MMNCKRSAVCNRQAAITVVVCVLCVSMKPVALFPRAPVDSIANVDGTTVTAAACIGSILLVLCYYY